MKIESASLPQPDSPVISTLASVAAPRSPRLTASRISCDNATISITILLSKNLIARGRPASDLTGPLRAIDAQDHRSVALYLRRYEPQNRRNQSGSIRRFDSLRPAPPEFRCASVVRRSRQRLPAPAGDSRR